MLLGILVPAVLIFLGVVAVFVWYRRKMEAMKPGDGPTPSGIRLTAERLRRLDGSWRVVYEIPAERLGGIDHVVVGPPGAVAIRTRVGDRPTPETADDSADAVATAAIERGDVDDLLRPIGGRCELLATVWWGSPRPDAPAADRTAPGSWSVEGQRLADWLASLPATGSTPADVDRWWQAITTGIGRPDPLA